MRSLRKEASSHESAIEELRHLLGAEQAKLERALSRLHAEAANKAALQRELTQIREQLAAA